MENQLLKLYLRDGQNAQQYVHGLPAKLKLIATEAILECSRLGYPLNNMDITSKAQELHIALRLPVIVWRVLNMPTTKAYSLLLFYRWLNNRNVSDS